MKKYYYIFFAALIVVLATNYVLFHQIYNNHLAYQKNYLFHQSEICGGEIEKTVTRFASEINYILYSDDLSEIFYNEKVKESHLEKLKVFYSSYKTLILNVYIYDNEKNIFNLFQDKVGNFIGDYYVAQRQKTLSDKGELRFKDGSYQYCLPVFKGSQVYGNIVVSLDFTGFISKSVDKYHLKEMLWQWVLDEKGEIIYTNASDKTVQFIDIEDIYSNHKKELQDFTSHKVIIDKKQERVLSVYYPLNLLSHKFGIVFSINNNKLINNVIFRSIYISGASIFLLSLTLLILLRVVRNKLADKAVVDKQLANLKFIMEQLPIGLIILDEDNTIKNINKTAENLLFIKEDETLIGKDVSDRFFLSKAYRQSDLPENAFDSNQFMLYHREGNEVIIYKKEVPITMAGEVMMLEAFIDVTSLEKARKYEAASNTAKSEFLAKMSHEIRTPMNGIIGMTEALNNEKLNAKQKEYVEIIKKSADLLLSIVDDILDFSKIEAGKMRIEEIPFNLQEELMVSLDLFKPITEEKGIKLTTHIGENIGNNYIGDPFRLRQVLSNLISNSVKFTHQGEIKVSVEVEEEYSGNVTLLFSVEDTGIGIPEQKRDSIFSSFTQVDESTSRKYGGSGLGTTISKQLVTLMNGEIWVESPSSISADKKYPGTKFSFTIEVYSDEKLKKDLDFSKIKSFSKVNAIVATKTIDTKKRFQKFAERLALNLEVLDYSENMLHETIIRLKNGEDYYHLVFIFDEPDFDGIEVAKKLHSDKLTDKFVYFLFSTNHKTTNYVQTKVHGVDFYIIQPFEHNALLNQLYEIFPSIPKPEHETEPEIRKDLSILVVEDNLINQRVAQMIFQQLGLNVEIADDGQLGVDMVKEKYYDIVFMDLVMPEKDGVRATVDIRGMGYQMPIVAMTATASDESKKQALSAGMNDYIIKPIKIETVRKILSKWFA